MNFENPYAAPAAPIEPPKVDSPLLRYLDVAGIICAAMPLLCFVGLVTTFLIMSGEDPSETLAVVLGLSFFATCILWLIGGLYNCVRVCQGRKLALLGIVLNLVSLVIWAGIIYLAIIQ